MCANLGRIRIICCNLSKAFAEAGALFHEMGSRFCKDGRSCWIPDVQAFLRYVDGKAAEGACLL